MELTNLHILPLLRERGISLHWNNHNTFARLILDTSLPLTGADTDICKKKDSVGGSEAEGELRETGEGAVDCRNVLSSSFASLSEFMLSHMIPEGMTDCWLSETAMHHSLSYMLCAALVHSGWNKWTLVYDPQDLALCCIQQCSKELLMLDATNR